MTSKKPDGDEMTAADLDAAVGGNWQEQWAGSTGPCPRCMRQGNFCRCAK